MTDPLNKLYKYFYAQYQGHKEQAGQPKSTQGFVTISRQAGAGGITVGEKLCQYLNEALPAACAWTVFDKNLVNEVIKESNFPAEMMSYLKEECIPGLEDAIEGLFGMHPAQSILVSRTSQTILHLARMGRSIIVGRGAPVITRFTPGGVHVRLVGSLQKRKQHLMDHYHFDDKKAESFIHQEDYGRAGYLKRYFGRNIDDPLLYDLVINTDSVSYDEAALLIKDMVVRKIKSETVSAV